MQAMHHLMVKRPLDIDRREVFSQAEAFAAMVSLEYVLTSGIYVIQSSQCSQCLKSWT